MKKIYLLFILFLGLQFFQIDKKNPEFDQTKELKASNEVISILEKSCYDCHSHKTKYPLYSYIFPISSFLKSHIEEGRVELNFSIWEEYSDSKKKEKLEEIIEEIESNEMPIFSYRIVHWNSKVNSSELEILKSWVKNYK